MLWRLLLSRFIALMLVGLAFSGALSPTAHALTLLETIGYKTISLDLSSHTKTSEGYHRVKKVIDYDRPAPKHVPPPVELRGIPSRTTHVTTIHRDIRRIEQQLLIDCAAQTYAVQDTKHFDKNFKPIYQLGIRSLNWRYLNTQHNKTDKKLYRLICR